jgi:hypothetical protein
VCPARDPSRAFSLPFVSPISEQDRHARHRE